MKFLKTSTLIILLLTLSYSAFAQRFTFSGMVTDVLDSKTVSVQTNKGMYKVQLQFIEPPERDQPMADIMKDHLSKLTKGKSATVTVRMTQYSIYIARVVIEGIDISSQLLRDGAAWYSVPNASAQDPAEREQYLEMETLAKAEKRGVWAGDLTPAWELRLAREKAEKDAEEKEALDLAKKRASGALATKPYLGMSQLEFSLTCPIEAKDRVHITYDILYKPQSTYELGYSERRSDLCIGEFEFYNRILTKITLDSR